MQNAIINISNLFNLHFIYMTFVDSRKIECKGFTTDRKYSIYITKLPSEKYYSVMLLEHYIDLGNIPSTHFVLNVDMTETELGNFNFNKCIQEYEKKINERIEKYIY